MRTTLTLDDDVAALLERIRAESGASLRDVVNAALRRGLADFDAPPVAMSAYRTRQVRLGRCLVGNLDDVSGALNVAEGDDFR